ncbi:hypothetical protein EDD37DRAFT_604787 [Exophiala viscosa]|uniref:Transmembrane protein n=1 Tax=Exophiala viscosa TaxID=2486360 RepID=A0AAN6IGD4_9EURO|nr:hypothetical protein EDD36DRAFT_415418 [Exophiala viscosa]KAI1629919.1 hypothetical protein EDD37DRAFT_604787 [Exophiala viscosa]
MAWYSILPTQLTFLETWIIRGFLLLALINILPWILALVYDFLLYLGRVVRHEVPFFGGRARGENRPRAPSLRASTAKGRRLSFVDIVTGTTRQQDTGTESRQRAGQGHGHQKSLSRDSIAEEWEGEGKEEEEEEEEEEEKGK